RSYRPVVTDSNGTVAGNDLSCFRIARELRSYRVNGVCLAGTDFVRTNKQPLCVSDIHINTTRVGVVCTVRGSVKAKASGVDAVAQRKIVGKRITLVDEVYQGLVSADTEWIESRNLCRRQE